VVFSRQRVGAVQLIEVREHAQAAGVNAKGFAYDRRQGNILSGKPSYLV
jgi:hypothetical protein